MSNTVYCITKTDAIAVRIVRRLQENGVADSDISVLGPDSTSIRDLGVDNSTKAPEGAATGATAGAIAGGALGWAAGIGALAIPGIGPFIAAGPILAALSGAAIGSAAGGLTGALVGLGIPEYEAKQYEGRLRQGHYLLSVHVDDWDEASRVRGVMSDEGAEDISTGSEADVPKESEADATTARRS
jgi:hypothetical protein